MIYFAAAFMIYLQAAYTAVKITRYTKNLPGYFKTTDARKDIMFRKENG